jgi:asparagine synthase (glutamine-hydrolysing)
VCGICGTVNFNGMAPLESSTLQKMCAAIKHRGPDDEGTFIRPTVGLGMRRLSIIDLSGGHQPIFNESGTICIVFNGEIYNYLELRHLLEKLGHHFCTQCDTEVIVHAYEQWGKECPNKLRGMFAFAIWDAGKEELFIARDRLGQKPLYYHLDGNRFVFASEIKAILQYATVPRRINFQALDAFLTLGYVPAPDTMFDGISKLPAGHSLSLGQGHCQIEEYWDLAFRDEQPKSLVEYREQLQHLLEESVRIRLMSDVPLGAFLSGGIDSSIIVALMSRMMNQPVDTFSVGFEEEEHNELPFARIAARQFTTNHHEIPVNLCSPDLIEKLVWHLDEPIADPAAVPTYLVSELARRDVTVVLTGEGGDELFAGYDYYKTDRWARRYQVVPGLGRRALPALARGINALLGRQRYHERTIWYWSLPPGAQMAAWVAIFTDAEKDKLYSRSFRQCLGRRETAEAFAHFYDKCNTQDNLHRQLYIDSKVWLPDDLLMKVDKMSMATSLEARTPFLDHHLLEFVATMPPHFKLNHSTSKFILKEIAEEILPPEIIHRPKHTFDVPIGKWLKGSLRDLTLDLVTRGIVPDEELFDQGYILGEMWQGLEENKPGYARQFWSLINLGLWTRQFCV